MVQKVYLGQVVLHPEENGWVKFTKQPIHKSIATFWVNEILMNYFKDMTTDHQVQTSFALEYSVIDSEDEKLEEEDIVVLSSNPINRVEEVRTMLGWAEFDLQSPYAIIFEIQFLSASKSMLIALYKDEVGRYFIIKK